MAWPSLCLSLTRLLLLLDIVGSVENNYDINNPGHDHVAAAILFDENGDMQAAVQSFRAAAKYQPTNPVNWRNLAISLQEIDAKESTPGRMEKEGCGVVGNGNGNERRTTERDGAERRLSTGEREIIRENYLLEVSRALTK